MSNQIFRDADITVEPHYQGMQIFCKWQDTPALSLNVADAHRLAQELDVQVALASGLELLTVRADAVLGQDILWDLGKLSVVRTRTEHADVDDLTPHQIDCEGAELYFRADVRLRVGRAIV